MSVERLFLLRLLVDEDADVDEEHVTEALTAAEQAANEELLEGGKFKVGPEVDAYRRKVAA